MINRIKYFWEQVHTADTDRIPCLKLVEKHFDELVRKAEFIFVPDETGCERHLTELSDGQRSLFHIALTAATLASEIEVLNSSHDKCPFKIEKLHRVYLTILAIEEPENCLSPFFLSRITRLSMDIGKLPTAQVLLSSHSPAILGRIEPTEVRYLRMNLQERRSSIRSLLLPKDNEEASRYVRLAVKAYPELYFARFVVLVEGDSERIVIPFIAEKMGISLDPSFVPIVPLGGRYVSHFWKLLNDLQIPHATLLDLDLGRKYGGVSTIKRCFVNLTVIGKQFWNETNSHSSNVNPDTIELLQDTNILEETFKNEWLQTFQEEGIFFSYPLDIDFSMLLSFPDAYQATKSSASGPRNEQPSKVKNITLKTDGKPELYSDEFNDAFKWYPYLFLNRSKPETHISALSQLSDPNIISAAPNELVSLIKYIKKSIEL